MTEAFLRTLDVQIPQRLQALNLPGAALALIADGQVAAIRTYGFADRERQTLVTPDTLFRLASISKSVAAWAVLLLVQRGRVELDAPIDRYLKRWRLPPSDFERNGVTVRRLLAHMAGISTPGVGRVPHGSTETPLLDGLEGRHYVLNEQQQRYYARWSLPPDAPITLAHAPGSGHRYANGGFSMLELMIEEVSGCNYADFVALEIFAPLGMRHAGFDPLPPDAQAATGYAEDGSAVGDLQPLSKAAGGMWASIVDLARFACAELAAPTVAPGGGVLTAHSIDSLFTSQGFAMHDAGTGLDFDAGLGHFVCHVGGLLNVHHSGGFSGWRSIYSVLPQTGSGFCMLVNSDGGNELWQPLIQQWAQSALGAR